MRFLFAILTLVSVVLATGSGLAAPTFRARPVVGPQVMKMLYAFNAPASEIRDFGEIGEAIALASTQDPIFPEIEEGAELTAAMLVAVAWHESRFQRSVVGDNGRSFGLFQIQPGTHKVDSKLLTVPRTATFIAIGLMKQSVKWCFAHERPWREALAWYAASSDAGARHPKIVAQSTIRMETMAKVYSIAFGQPQAEKEAVGKLLLARGER